MKISDVGLNIIKEFEGYYAKLPNGDCKAYKCPAGVWTIGYGCTEGVKPGMVWTQKQAEEALLKEISKLEQGVLKLVKAPITQNMFDALVSFSYNCGLGALSKSTVLKRTNEQEYQAAAKAFGMWIKGGGRVLPGLVKRRAKEAELYLTPPMPSPKPDTPDRTLVVS
ncbi:MAG: lysozyme [Hyphomicrobium sp.]